MYKLQSNNRIFLDLSLHKKWKFSIKDFFRSFLQIWSHLLKKSLMENFIFLCSVKIFRIRIFSVPYLPAFGEIRNISLYLVRMQQNTDQKSSKHGQFSRSGDLSFWSLKIWVYSQQTFTLSKLTIETLEKIFSNLTVIASSERISHFLIVFHWLWVWRKLYFVIFWNLFSLE